MLERLKGQQRAKHILKGFIEKQRIPSSLMFVGRDGIGKKTAALYFAMALNCKTKPMKGCGQCSICRRIESCIHPDVVIIDGTRAIGIEEVRGVQRKLHFRPVEGEKNVIIIDGAENMTPPASNALLKTLEEPPSHSVIILITSSPYSLPMTVISRCYRVPFEPLQESEILEILMERNVMDREKAMVISTICGGSVAEALEAEGCVGLKEAEGILSMLVSLKGANTERIAEYARQLGSRDETFLNRLFSIVRCFLLDGLKYKIDCLDYIKYRNFKERIMEFTSDLRIDELLYLIERTGRYQRILDFHPNRPLLMELYLHEIKGIYLKKETDEAV
uniref:DNA polymerase III subunit delta' n=1 Tax=uncultured prokaryote TaxID=198431 RepID=H5SEK0_9ZZZZ|nr:DNA polymerase III subunit delta' [uncultured prokaryote]